MPAFLIAHWLRIREELLTGTYQPAAIKRVVIPKGGGGVREPGIPTLLDRFIQQSALTGRFRPGRSAHAAEGLLIGLVPLVIATVLLMGWADVEQYRASALGRYVKEYMTRTLEGIRLAGVTVWWVAAWYHRAVLVGVGVLVILSAWGSGVIRPRRA